MLQLLFIYLFIYGRVGSSFLCEGFPRLRQAGAALHRGARASHYRGLSCCGAQAPDAQAQQLWLTGPVAPQHVGSSQTRARTRVPCIGRQTLNHCATREAPSFQFWCIKNPRLGSEWQLIPRVPLGLAVVASFELSVLSAKSQVPIPGFVFLVKVISLSVLWLLNWKGNITLTCVERTYVIVLGSSTRVATITYLSTYLIDNC